MEMSEIFKPMAVQAGLMIAVTYWLAWARIGSLVRGKVTRNEVARNGWQGWIKNAGDNYSNQFEMPLLFFVVCTLLYLSQSVTPFVVLLAWAFVVLRIVHALVHLSVNIILLRFLVFFSGGIVLTILYIILVGGVF